MTEVDLVLLRLAIGMVIGLPLGVLTGLLTIWLLQRDR